MFLWLVLVPLLSFADFLPENSLRIPVSEKAGGLTLEQFHSTINKVGSYYGPIVRMYGGRLFFDRKWDDPTVNAGTYREDGTNKWIVNLYGGFARHPLLTPDGFALVICHEIGHHVGGAPKKYMGALSPTWAGTEGQSDYFATLKCLRKVFQGENNAEAIKDLEIPPVVSDACRKSFRTDWEAALCMRTSMAGFSVASVAADSLKLQNPTFDFSPQMLALTTHEGHSSPQCRLETYFMGSICDVSSRIWVSQVDEVTGTCHPLNGHVAGNRPSCWFRATLIK